MKIFTALMAAWGSFCFAFVIMSAVEGGLSASCKWYQWIANVLFVVLSFWVFDKE